MTREEILAKSREENKNMDERDRQINTGAYKAAYITCYFLIGLFMLSNQFMDLPFWFYHAISVFFEGTTCAYHAYTGIMKKSWFHTIMGIGWGIFALISLVRFYHGIF